MDSLEVAKLVRRMRSLSARILLSVLAILVASMALGFGLYLRIDRANNDQLSRQRALDIAITTAAMPDIREQMATGDTRHEVAALAEQVRHGTGASYVVIIDASGIRHSHPDPALIGEPIGRPLPTRDGHDHLATDVGATGRSANGKAPLRAPDGHYIGEVSVGIPEAAVAGTVWSEVPSLLAYGALALALGALAAFGLAAHIRRITYGLELSEFATLMHEREAMLHGIREGVLGLDPQNRLSVINDEARALLQLPTARPGQVLDDLLPPGRLRSLLSGEVAAEDATALTVDTLLLVNRRPVRLGGRDIGAVVTLRDRTELESLLRELHAVSGLTQALRAQEHEFSNRIHVAAGLLELGETDEAARYLREISNSSVAQAEELRSRIHPPMVAALLVAKISVAAERDVVLTVADSSSLDLADNDVAALLTILGNLVDNAIDAAAGAASPAHVSVTLEQVADGVRLDVADSGPGIPAEAADEIFTDGWTTKTQQGAAHRGLGLALVNRLVLRDGGRIEVSAGPGACFMVWLPIGAHPVQPSLRASRLR